jgi:hypothetical protein
MQATKLFQTDLCRCGKLKQVGRSCKSCNATLERQRAIEADRRRLARLDRNTNPFSR